MYHHGKLNVGAIKFRSANNFHIHIAWTQDKKKATILQKMPKIDKNDNMYKYEMDLTCIMEDTEQIRFCPRTDGQTDKVKPVYTPTPFNFVEAVGIITHGLECCYIWHEWKWKRRNHDDDITWRQLNSYCLGALQSGWFYVRKIMMFMSMELSEARWQRTLVLYIL